MSHLRLIIPLVLVSIVSVSLGAGFDLGMIPAVLLPAALLAGLAVLVKPPVFRWLLRQAE